MVTYLNIERHNTIVGTRIEEPLTIVGNSKSIVSYQQKGIGSPAALGKLKL